ncbi:ribosome hibernation-promoting factor, HPF/YfiA family [Noviherbaspirillum galbum]|uniref:Ribosome hibernation promoting factor n=1 Tax=Noviherbaspirillum galbum TaxID=2709383 RepID=A0A6B3SZC3_9BURK|nr:ribosome-associated translation inhibitor RaiA [Noviherbaspirillum galbum]NEX63919.1 ribosome-associated translation inhibitor RaiA [Noviherbaspirillum galbum]
MNLLLTGQHVDVSPALREYVEKKLERITRHFDQIIDIAVVLGVEKPSEKEKRQRAEINMRLKGNVIHVEHFAEDLYAAVDCAVDKLDRQVLKYKGKVQDHQHESIKRSPERLEAPQPPGV